MASARQIHQKSNELNGATDVLQEMVARRTYLVQEAQDLQARIAAQQAVVQGLRAELVALVNEP